MIGPEDFAKAWQSEVNPAKRPRALVRVLCAYHGTDLQPLPAEPDSPLPPTFGCPDPDCTVQVHIEVRTVPDTEETT